MLVGFCEGAAEDSCPRYDHLGYYAVRLIPRLECICIWLELRRSGVVGKHWFRNKMKRLTMLRRDTDKICPLIATWRRRSRDMDEAKSKYVDD